MNYLDSNMPFLSNNKYDQINDMALAMNDASINDFTKVPVTVFSDWVVLVRMNDLPGRYNNMLSFEKRQQLIKNINEWKKVNFQ